MLAHFFCLLVTSSEKGKPACLSCAESRLCVILVIGTVEGLGHQMRDTRINIIIGCTVCCDCGGQGEPSYEPAVTSIRPHVSWKDCFFVCVLASGRTLSWCLVCSCRVLCALLFLSPSVTCLFRMGSVSSLGFCHASSQCVPTGVSVLPVPPLAARARGWKRTRCKRACFDGKYRQEVQGDENGKGAFEPAQPGVWQDPFSN